MATYDPSTVAMNFLGKDLDGWDEVEIEFLTDRNSWEVSTDGRALRVVSARQARQDHHPRADGLAHERRPVGGLRARPGEATRAWGLSVWRTSAAPRWLRRRDLRLEDGEYRASRTPRASASGC
jgi:hypothetical protein